jgi:hypothetical protein
MRLRPFVCMAQPSLPALQICHPRAALQWQYNVILARTIFFSHTREREEVMSFCILKGRSRIIINPVISRHLSIIHLFFLWLNSDTGYW